MAQTEKYKKISVSLTGKMLDSIKERTKNGDYSSTSEVIRQALRVFDRSEEEYQLKLNALRNRLEHAANSGIVTMDEAFDSVEELHNEYMSRQSNEKL